MENRKRVIIIGAGFAGLRAARRLADQPVDVVVIDRNNYHTFTPLLYQVATCALDPSSVAYPIRTILRGYDNTRFLLGEVSAIDCQKQVVTVNAATGRVHEEHYDYLFVAAGSKTNYFGSAEIEQHSFGLRDLQDSLAIRNHVLHLFEKAVWETDEQKLKSLLTLVVVGGGATGLETAGALHELYNKVLEKEYDSDNRMEARVVLLEAADNLLLPYPDNLQESARRQLESLGVEVHTGAFVDDVGSGYIQLRDGETIHTHTIVWATGVVANPLAEMLGVELVKGGRVPVTQELRVTACDNVFAAGDISYLENPKTGNPYPGLIPVAQQQGDLVAKNILHAIKGEPLETFSYFDRGIMATIGRSRAVAWVFNRISLTGYFAWAAWLVLHIVALLGMRNRLQVFLAWVWDYIFYDRSVRIIDDSVYLDAKLQSATDENQMEDAA